MADRYEEARIESKRILGSFAKALSKVKIKAKESKVSEGGFRNESGSSKVDDNFRRMMFENAPQKDGDFIVAEKKEWQ